MKTLFPNLLVLVAAIVFARLIGIYPMFAMTLMCLAIFACAFNLMIGFAGLMSFGHAMFFGTGGYIAGYVTKSWGFTPELALLSAMAVTALMGLIAGLLAVRSKGVYFAMITLALSQMVYFILVQSPFTGGEDGLQGIPRNDLFGVLPLTDERVMYVFVSVVFLGAFAAIWRIIHSPFGLALKAIRDSEPRMQSLGYDSRHYKVLAFVLSAGFSGLAGGLKSIVLGFQTLFDAHWHYSGEVLIMTLFGGIGTFLGPVVGAVGVGYMQHSLAGALGEWVSVIMGSVFVICVLAFRKGIVGVLGNGFGGWAKLSRRK